MKIGILGGGKMGRSIFSLFSETSMKVTVLGRDPAEMDRQNRRNEKRLRRAVSSGMLDEAALPRRLAALKFTTSWDDLRGCDLVIETISEDFDKKVDVLRRAEEMIAPDGVLTSNTSSLSITRLAEHLQDPTRFCGLHFFHPVQLTSTTEIIIAPKTAPGVVEFLRQVSRDIGRTPLVVRDLAGSCLNVPLALHCCEVLYVLEQGLASPSSIDRMISGRFSRLGPCETMDVIGVPLMTDLVRPILAAFAVDQAVPELCQRLIRDGRVGKYANQGIYLYQGDRPTDSAREYYLNPAQTHTLAGVRSDENGLRERLEFPFYLGLLKVAHAGLADLGELCRGLTDVIGLTVDPLEEMRKLGSKGLRETFDRLRDELGPRFDCRELHGIMATLDDR
jgi:3-hydroxybutyryl-CoA dehydrogenase